MTRPPARRATRLVHPSGAQFVIARGAHRVTVVEVGGGIRAYRVGGRPVLEHYPIDAMCDGAHGAVLVPWPNRLADGRYRFDGVDHQVALTEPEKSNAIHGFLRWRSWRASHHRPDCVVMETTLHPQEGYPYLLEVSVAYELDDNGLTVTTTAANLGTATLPYGCGHHPYLSPGDGLLNDCTLEVSAATRILTDNPRQLPTGTEAVAGSPFDFSAPRLIGDLQMDYPFTDLRRDADHRARVRLRGTDGRTAELWADESFPILELYTGDTLAPDRQRRGLGVEPMTCPPNAFATGENVLRIEPDESVTTQWGVSLTQG